MNQIWITVGSVFTLMGLSMPYAVADAQESARLIETVLVTGSMPASRELLTHSRGEFTAEERRSVGGLFSGLPGLQIDNRTNAAQDARVVYRGFGARSAFGIRGVKLYQNGIPLSSPDGQGQVSMLSSQSIESIELVKGPLASLYGAGAGAALLINTQDVAQSELGLRFSQGPHDSTNVSGELGGRYENFYARMIAGRIQSDGVRDHSEMTRNQLWLQAGFWAAPDWRVEILHEATRDPLLQDPLGLTHAEWRDSPKQVSAQAVQFNTRKAVSDARTSLSLTKFGERMSGQASVWQSDREVTQYLAVGSADISRSGGVIDFDRATQGALLNALWQDELLAKPWRLRLGGEGSSMDEDRRGFVNQNGMKGDLRRDEDNRVSAQEAYAITHWQLLNNWEWFGGVRHSRLNYEVDDHYVVMGDSPSTSNPDDSGARDYQFLSHAMGFLWTPLAHWTTGVSIGRGHEAPTLTEMAYSRNNAGFNRQLGASNNRQVQWDVHYGAEQLFSHFSVFSIDSADEIVVDESVGGRTTYRNAAATDRQGAEWQLGVLSDNGYATLNTSFIEAQLCEAQQVTTLPGVAQWQYGLTLGYRLQSGSSPVWLRLRGEYRAKVYADDANSLIAPAFTVWYMSAEKSVNLRGSDLRMWLSLDNATNENYVGSVIVNQSFGRAFEPAPPRQLVAGFEIRL